MPGMKENSTLVLRLAPTVEDVRRTWQPVILRLEDVDSGATISQAVTECETLGGDGGCIIRIQDVPPGTYSLRVADVHTRDTVFEQDQVVIPGDEIDVRRQPVFPAVRGIATGEAVPRQINTLTLDVAADAPYRLERSATYLPVIVLFKDVDPGDVRVTSIDLFGYTSPDSARPLARGAIHAVYDGDGSQVEHRGRPALLRPDRGKRYETIRTDHWYRVVLLRRQALPELQGGYLEHHRVRYHQYRVDVSYERGILHLGDTTRFVLRTLGPDADLPCPNGWYLGDTHYHSDFTDNPYEYGGPLLATAEAAKAVGLSWVTVTDHSYCLTHTKTPQEKRQGNRWRTYQQAVREMNTRYPDTLLVPAEEITLRKGLAGLHMLSFGNQFIEDTHVAGFGSVTLKDAFERLAAPSPGRRTGSVFAAHPASDGHVWEDGDYHVAKEPRYGDVFKGLQLFNEKIVYSESSESPIEGGVLDPCAILGDEDRRRPWSTQLREGVREHWVDRLLIPSLWECEQTGQLRKFFALAGSDAHMDFNYALRPHPLFFKHSVSDNAFGKVRTLAHLPGPRNEALTEANLLDALRNGRTVLTDGPVVLFSLRRGSDGREYVLGDTVTLSLGEDLDLTVDWLSTPEFGPLHRISLYLGTTGGETDVSDKVGGGALGTVAYGLAGRREHRFADWAASPCYLRLEAASGLDPATNEEHFVCFTNPVWILVPAT